MERRRPRVKVLAERTYTVEGGSGEPGSITVMVSHPRLFPPIGYKIYVEVKDSRTDSYRGLWIKSFDRMAVLGWALKIIQLDLKEVHRMEGVAFRALPDFDPMSLRIWKVGSAEMALELAGDGDQRFAMQMEISRSSSVGLSSSAL